ncbi:hypothetical protein [Candidatus Nitrosocosmicus hydrocola]|uniref:hypothetical protein n=1 Tax=Candidatus Nitrosocosmicus hydrocola TaxID=1826872 RepID=UPI0011E588C3|nr:hypothetical protein [Candidatus Nitrosocosmicus hydrocola]
MDELTFRKLRESNYYSPTLTEVIINYDMMLEMVFHSMTIIEKGYDTVWDANVLNFIGKYFQEGIEYVEKLVRQNGIKIRMIVEATIENMDALDSLQYYDVRCLDDIKGNFGIFDNRAYMVCIFQKNSDKPDQTLWSNSKDLVDKQRVLFEKMWSMAVPLSVRKKELEYLKKMNSKKKITDFELLQSKIDSLIIGCKSKLIIFSSAKILCNILSKNDFEDYFPLLLRKGVIIKILIDREDSILIKYVSSINATNHYNKIQLTYSNKMIEFNESMIMSDDKNLLQAKYDSNNQLIAYFSTDKSNVLLQEILFEKHWNEVNSLNIINEN